LCQDRFNPDELCVRARALETSTAAAGSAAPGQEPGRDEANCFAGVAVRGHYRDSGGRVQCLDVNLYLYYLL